MKRLAILFAALALTACASGPAREPKVEIQPAYMPKPVSCVAKDFVDRPSVPDTDAALRAEPDLDKFQNLLAAGREIRDAWITAAQAQIDICRRAAN